MSLNELSCNTYTQVIWDSDERLIRFSRTSFLSFFLCKEHTCAFTYQRVTLLLRPLPRPTKNWKRFCWSGRVAAFSGDGKRRLRKSNRFTTLAALRTPRRPPMVGDSMHTLALAACSAMTLPAIWFGKKIWGRSQPQQVGERLVHRSWKATDCLCCVTTRKSRFWWLSTS